MEPNVTKYCLVCKEYNTALMQVEKGEYLCKDCAESFGHKFKPEKDKKDQKSE